MVGRGLGLLRGAGAGLGLLSLELEHVLARPASILRRLDLVCGPRSRPVGPDLSVWIRSVTKIPTALIKRAKSKERSLQKENHEHIQYKKQQPPVDARAARARKGP